MIQEIGKNKYKLIVNVNENGKRICRKTKVVNCGKREANRLYKEFEDKVRLKLTDDSLYSLIREYIRFCELKGCTPTTIRGYNKIANRIEKFIADKKAQDVSASDINRLVIKLSEKYSAKTIDSTLSLLNATMTRAVDLGLLQTNPCRKVSKPKIEQKEISTLSAEDIPKFMEMLNSFELDMKVAIELALFCGLRRSEICGLKQEDYNKGTKTLWVRRSRHWNKDYGESVQATKTVKSNRVITVPPFLADEIEKLIELHDSYEFKHDEWLILDIDTGIKPDTLSSRLYRMEEKFGLPILRLHALRHSYTTMLLNSQEVDIAQISRQLGHSNTTTTLNVYSHATGGASASSTYISGIIEEIVQNTTLDTTQE